MGQKLSVDAAAGDAHQSPSCGGMRLHGSRKLRGGGSAEATSSSPCAVESRAAWIVKPGGGGGGGSGGGSGVAASCGSISSPPSISAGSADAVSSPWRSDGSCGPIAPVISGGTPDPSQSRLLHPDPSQASLTAGASCTSLVSFASSSTTLSSTSSSTTRSNASKPAAGPPSLSLLLPAAATPVQSPETPPQSPLRAPSHTGTPTPQASNSVADRSPASAAARSGAAVAAAGPSANATAGPAGPRVAMVIPLNPPVLGLTALQVCCVERPNQVTPAHVTWLRQGWASVQPEALGPAGGGGVGIAGTAGPVAGAAIKPGKKQGKQGKAGILHAPGSQGGAEGRQQPKSQPRAQANEVPKVVGIDTEFIGDQLALLQLCCGDRAVLVRVPAVRSAVAGAGDAVGAGAGARGTASKAGSGSGRAGEDPGSGSGRGLHGGQPAKCPNAIETLLCDPELPKAAAEAWQDALMIFIAFGVKLRNGLDLTTACPPSEEDRQRGRKKLSLFDIFGSFFPQSSLRKDKSIDHSLWHTAKTLQDSQIKYGALDAFVSYAAGVKVLTRSQQQQPKPVDLALPPHWEVTLAAQWVATHQFLEAAQPDRTKHDFQHATFQMTEKGLTLDVRMSRFNTRLRRNAWVDVLLRDGRRLNGICTYAHGKSALVRKLKWAGTSNKSTADVVTALGGQLAAVPATRRPDVKPEEVAGAAVANIEMSDGSESKEEEQTSQLLSKILCGNQSLRSKALAVGIFGSKGVSGYGSTEPGAGAGGSSSSAASKAKGAVAAKAKAKAKAAKGGQTRGSAAAAIRADVARHLSDLHSASAINDTQRAAMEAILMGHSAVQVVQGPPGTGKTTVISHAVDIWSRHIAPRLPTVGDSDRKVEAMACVARSNVAAKNIALALIKRGLGKKDFRLVVSNEYFVEWHEEQYRGALQEVLVVSEELQNADMPRMLADVRVFVTTVSMLAGSRFKETALYGKVLTRLMVDEASQYYVGSLLLPLHKYGEHLRSLSFFGDDMQLPPYGSAWDGAQIPSVFDHFSLVHANQLTTAAAVSVPGGSHGGGSSRLRSQPNAFCVGPRLLGPSSAPATAAAAGGAACAGPSWSRTAAAADYPPCGTGANRTDPGGAILDASAAPGFYVVRLMLDVSYRLPVSLCEFIGCEMYGGLLRSGRALAAAASGPALRWVDVAGKEERRGTTSCCNPQEAEAVCSVVKRNFLDSSWTVLTGYDLQRSVLEKAIKKWQLPARSGAATTGSGTSHCDSGCAAADGSGSGGGSSHGQKKKGGQAEKPGSQTDGSDRVYNVDTFQGREDEVVVASLVRSGTSLGFMEDDRRVNVMLTRCTRHLVVVGSLQLALLHPSTLIGRMAAHCRDRGLVLQPAP